MNALQTFRKLFGYDDRFFNLLEAGAIEANSSVQLLVRLIKDPQAVGSLGLMVQVRRKEKRIAEEIWEQLCKTFVTPLEREDIEALSTALYKIPKTVEKFTEKFVLTRERVQDVDFTKQVAILEQSAATMVQMVKHLRQRTHAEEVKEHNDRLHFLEGEADDLMMDSIRELYSGRHDPLKVIVILDLHETLEKIIDRCRDAGNIIFQVILKYS
jgi:uncharacterized protein